MSGDLADCRRNPHCSTPDSKQRDKSKRRSNERVAAKGWTEQLFESEDVQIARRFAPALQLCLPPLVRLRAKREIAMIDGNSWCNAADLTTDMLNKEFFAGSE